MLPAPNVVYADWVKQAFLGSDPLLLCSDSCARPELATPTHDEAPMPSKQTLARLVLSGRV